MFKIKKIKLPIISFMEQINGKNAKKKNTMVWVRERTTPTERPPLVGEVIANFCGLRVPRGQRNGSLWPYSRFSRQETLLFYRVAPQLYSRGWVDPVPNPLLFSFFFFSFRKSGSAGNRTRASGSVAKNSDHYTTEAVGKNAKSNKCLLLIKKHNNGWYEMHHR
jgi:hypothetical protein